MSTNPSPNPNSTFHPRALFTFKAPFLRRSVGLLVVLAALGISFYGVKVGWRWCTRHTPTLVTLNTEAHYQTIDGWAVYPRYWEDDKKGNRFDRSVENYTAPVSEFLVNQVGINSVRIELWSGLENPTDHWLPHYEGHSSYKEYAPLRYEKINDNDDPNVVNPAGFQFAKFDHRIEHMVLPILRAIEKNGEKPFINVCYVDFKWKEQDRSGTLSHAEDPAEFAEFVLVFFQRMRDKYGINPDAFELILEPENTEKWRGPTIGKGLLAVNNRLKANGFAPRFIAPSNTSMRNAIDYYDEMIRVPGVLDLLDTFAYHRYHVPLSSEVVEIWERAEAAQIKTAMLEKVGAGIDELMEDLIVGHVSSWQQWAAADREGDRDEGGYYARVHPGDANHPVSMNQRTPQLAQVFRTVRRGAVRIGARSSTSDKRAAAFRNSNGQLVVVVRGQRGGGKITLRALPAGHYRLSFIGDDGRTEQSEVSATGQDLDVRLRGPGVLTLTTAS